jgi:membrane-associated phospholipid phosphatase
MGTAEIDTTRRVTSVSGFLPRGWRDLAFQVTLWLGFLLLYQVARGLANRDPATAFANGLEIIDIEKRLVGLFELSIQGAVETTETLKTITAFTYWNSAFTVVAIALLWVYVRRHEHFHRLRNLLLLANVVGLLGYVLLPTAPPRMFPDFGFADSMSEFGGLNHGSGLIQIASNPYAAMPSLHSTGALIVGICLAIACRSWLAKLLWLAWPAWVWFCVMATANHFWLDIVGGIVVAVIAYVILRGTQRVVPASLRRRQAT